MRDYMVSQVTPPKRVTSPNWGPPPLCKQAFNPSRHSLVFISVSVGSIPRSNLFTSAMVRQVPDHTAL